MNSDKSMEIKITFKKSEKWLFDKLSSDEHTSRGAVIKDILIQHFKSEAQTKPHPVQRSFKGII